MSRIGNIYESAFFELPQARADDMELEKELKEYLETASWPVESWEELKDMVFAGGSYGQKRGFISGFRYAIALLLESLV